MGIRRFWNRLRVRGPSGEKVELRPVEQTVLALLFEKGSASTADIQARIDSRRTVLHQQAGEVVEALLRQGLAEARHDLESGAVFAPTAKGMRLRKRLPEDPKTVTDFWL